MSNQVSTKVLSSKLFDVIDRASNNDLSVLVKYISRAVITEKLTSSKEYQTYFPDHQKYKNLIEREIRLFGGNTLVNFVRKDGPDYTEIVKDVADKLKVKYDKDLEVEDIEDLILAKTLSDAFEQMEDKDKLFVLKDLGLNYQKVPKKLPASELLTIFNLSDVSAYQIALIVADGIAKDVLGYGFKISENPKFREILNVLSKPISLALTGILSALDILGPAYRVTIPCVIHVAMLRKQQALPETKRLTYQAISQELEPTTIDNLKEKA